MLIDLNGMSYHLKIRESGDGFGFVTEIADEAFHFGMVRETVSDTSGVVELVSRFSGILPDTDVLEQIQQRVEEIKWDQAGSRANDAVAHPAYELSRRAG